MKPETTITSRYWSAWRNLPYARRILSGTSAVIVCLCCLMILGSQSTSRLAHAGSRAVLDGAYPLASLRVLSESMNKVKTRYVKPDRVRPRLMVAKAIESLQRHVVPLLVTREGGDEDDGPDGLIVQMGEDREQFNLRSVKTIDKMVFVLMNIFQFIDARLPPDSNREDLETVATNAALHTLDPHTTYLDPGAYRNMQVETSGNFGGLGIVISIVKGDLTVIKVMEDTPAKEAGLMARDKVLQIDDESTVNMDLSEAVSRMRGKPGNPVSIRVLRKGWDAPRPYKITRAIIQIRSVVSKLLDGSVGYVRLKNFRANTSKQLKAHLKHLETETKGPLQGIILDLRGDPGGFLEQAIRVSDVFLTKGEIVRTIEAGNKLRNKREARPVSEDESKEAKTDYEKVPVVVLIDSGSASASEIVAGALKNHDRAVIVGTRSFGKGTVQGIYELGDGAVKVTIAEYLTPDQIPVHEVGVVPHIELSQIDPSPDDMLVFAHELFDRGPKKKAKPGTRLRAAQDIKPLRVVYFVKQHEELDEEARDNRRFEYDVVKQDFALKIAQALTTSSKAATSKGLLKSSRTQIDALEREENKRLEEALLKHGVDWSIGPKVSRPRLETEVIMDPPGGWVVAGESLRVTVRLTNTGTRDLHRIHAIGTSNSRLLDGREFLFGRIKRGQSRTWTTEIKPALRAKARQDPLKLKFYQDGKEVGLERTIVVGLREPERPRFGFSYLVDDTSGGNSDGRIQRGETISLTVLMKNIGSGSSGETTTLLKSLAGEGLFLERGRKTDEKHMNPGEMRPVSFTFEVRPTLSTSVIPFEVQVRDRKNGVFLRERIELPVHNPTTRRGTSSSKTFLPNEETQVYGGASTRFPVLAAVPPGTPLIMDVSAGRWGRVSVGSNLIGWTRVDLLKVTNGADAPKKDIATKISNRPPKMDIVEPQIHYVTTPTAQLKGQVTFYGAGAANERAVSIFVGRRKVWFDIRRNITDEMVVIPFDLQLDLKEGQNRVSIRMKEQERGESRQTVLIFREKEGDAK
ncbi:MAG: hypothetical protein CMH54_07255 [Myxococcales bacterium]|nr:hypothetical protein [Myxococcales bacterium]